MRSTGTLLLLATVLLCAGPSRAQIINTFAGNGFGAGTGVGGYSGDNGLAPLAELSGCSGVTFDGAGNVYITDLGNNVVRKVNGAGVISTFAGTGSIGYSGDGGPAVNATFRSPYGVAADAWGNVYISDRYNNVVRMVTPSGMISTVAGNGTQGYSGDGGAATAAQLFSPEGLAVDTGGNVYIADAYNNAIRVLYTDGTIGTIAGNGSAGYSGNGGPAMAAQLFGPTGVAVDIYGNVYIADFYNNAVRKVDTTGTITSLAGNGLAGYSGNDGPAAAAQLHYPGSVTVYGFGDVYISDLGNNVIRKVNTSGTISAFVGSGSYSYSGDGGLAIDAGINSPRSISVDGLGRLYVADYYNNVVRIVTANTAVRNVSPTTTSVQVYPNPSNGLFTIVLPATGYNATINVIDMMGNSVYSGKYDASSPRLQSLDLGTVTAGAYFITINSGGNVYRAPVTKM